MTLFQLMTCSHAGKPDTASSLSEHMATAGAEDWTASSSSVSTTMPISDETGLYYHATPDGSQCYANEQLSGSEKATLKDMYGTKPHE